MGDRANVEVVQHGPEGAKGSVFLYTHWFGTELPKTLQRALKRRERWDDEQYLARIIFCEMVGKDIKGETGFGISSFVGDGGRWVLTVDCKRKTVTMRECAWTFEEYVALKSPSWGEEEG